MYRWEIWIWDEYWTGPIFARAFVTFLCIGRNIRTVDPTKVRIGERRRDEDEPKLLGTTIGRVVPLLLVAPDHSSCELEASMDKLFDERGSGEQAKQGHFASGEQGVGIQLVSGGRGVRGEAIPTLPFVTSFVSATPEHEGEGHTDSVIGLNLRTISTLQRFILYSDSSHHSGANIAEDEADSFVRPPILVITAATTVTPTADPSMVVKEKIVKPSLFSIDFASAGTNPAMGGFADLSGSDFLVGGIRTIMSPKIDVKNVYFFASIRGMEHDQLFTDFNVRAARQMSLSVEVRMRAEYNIKEKRRLASVVEEINQLLKSRDEEIENLKAQLLLKESEAIEAIRLRVEASQFKVTEKSLQDEVNALNGRNTILEKERNALDVKVTDLEAIVASQKRKLADSNAQLTRIKSQNDDLADQVHELQVSSFNLKEKLSTFENLTERLEEFHDAQLKVVNDKFNKLYTDFVEVTLHLEERFYPHLLITIAGRRWLLTHGIELAIAKCLNSPEYLSAREIAVNKAIEKGMQDGLAARITHGREGRVLTDVAAHNPFAEADYVSALQQLQSVNFPLLAKLKANKDSSIEALMNIMRLEEPLAKRLDDYGVMGMDDQLVVNENEGANPFPNVDDAEPNIPQ
nr:transposase (putative), gypsy type [Tanacetum cinerariifolium]